MTINFQETATKNYRNIEQVQKIIQEAKVTVDSNLLELIDEAEAGDYNVMEELWKVFAFGLRGVKPNKFLAERYLYALHDRNGISGETYYLAETTADIAVMKSEFLDTKDEVVDIVTEAIRYMVNEVEPKHWDTERLYRLQAILDSLLDSDTEA